jgi:hypothetical protein
LANNLKKIQPGASPMASDINQLLNGLTGQADIGTLQLAPQTAAPSTPNINTVTGVFTGTYKYQLVYVTGWLDSYYNLYVSGFAPSAETTVTLTSQNASIMIPSFNAPIIGVLIYRTVAGGASGTEQFVGSYLLSSGGTFVDSVLDTNLGTNLPTAPTWLGTAVTASVPTTNTTGSSVALPYYDAQLATFTNTMNTSLAANTATVNSYIATFNVRVSDIKGTTQNPTIVNGKVMSVVHKDVNNAVIRTDTFDYSVVNLITETRVMYTGDTLTLKYHLDTLQTEVI